MSGWQVLDEERLLDRWPWVRVTRQRLRLEDGATIIDDWYQVDIVPFAVIFALTSDGRVALVEQYRHALRRQVLELPAGHVTGDETPLVAAQRELLEETGLQAAHWESLGEWVVDPEPGCGTAHAFLARQAQLAAEPVAMDLQVQSVRCLPLSEVRTMFFRGDFPVLATVATLGMGLARLDSLGDR